VVCDKEWPYDIGLMDLVLLGSGWYCGVGNFWWGSGADGTKVQVTSIIASSSHSDEYSRVSESICTNTLQRW
jgi:hypothetical protein